MIIAPTSTTTCARPPCAVAQCFCWSLRAANRAGMFLSVLCALGCRDYVCAVREVVLTADTGPRGASLQLSPKCGPVTRPVTQQAATQLYQFSYKDCAGVETELTVGQLPQVRNCRNVSDSQAVLFLFCAKMNSNSDVAEHTVSARWQGGRGDANQVRWSRSMATAS